MNRSPDEPSREPAEYPPEIDVQTTDSLIRRGEDFLLLDVRQPAEYEIASLPGAVLIPLGELSGRLSELEPYRDKRIVVHCHHGGRSMNAVRGLRQLGFSGAQNLAGGIDLWSQAVDPQVPRY
ncbi:MAG: rhodanese [Planctomycetaceae bacterium]|nr:MAG: rhodanese [Planctomycetaceae bacterium]